MSVSRSDDTLWNSPFILPARERQVLIGRDAEKRWLWQESADGQWAEPRELPLQADQLCAAVDARLQPQLVALSDGCFYHLQPQTEQFSKQLFYREESKQCSHLLLGADTQGALHLVYLAVDNRAARWWLLHHRYKSGGWEEPRVIDFGGGASLNYGSMALDRNDWVHLVYRISEQDQAGLYYRHFNPASSSWSKALPLGSAKEISHPVITADDDHNLHVAWTAAREESYLVNYRPMIKGGWPSGGWKPEVAISPSLTQQPFPLFTYQEGCLGMGWLEDSGITLYRYNKGGWEKSPQQQPAAEVRLVRCSTLSAAGTPLFYWILYPENGEPLPAAPHSPDERMQDLSTDFQKLEQYSETLVNRAATLSSTKARLEQALEEKRKELSSVSQQNKKTIREYQQSLEDKDRELEQLKERLNQTMHSLKSKTELSRKTWEEDKKRYLGELQALKKDRRQFDLILKEKENTVGKLESRCSEQERRLRLLQTENEALAEQLRAKGWSIKKLLGKMLHNKP